MAISVFVVAVPEALVGGGHFKAFGAHLTKVLAEVEDDVVIRELILIGGESAVDDFGMTTGVDFWVDEKGDVQTEDRHTLAEEIRKYFGTGIAAFGESWFLEDYAYAEALGLLVALTVATECGEGIEAFDGYWELRYLQDTCIWRKACYTFPCPEGAEGEAADRAEFRRRMAAVPDSFFEELELDTQARQGSGYLYRRDDLIRLAQLMGHPVVK